MPPASLWVVTGLSRQPPPWGRAVRALAAGLGSRTAPCHRDPAPGSGVAFVPAQQGTCWGLCSVPVQPSPTPGEPRGRVEQEGKRCPMGWEQLAPGMGLGMCSVPCPTPLQPEQAAGGQQSSQHQARAALGCGGAHSRDAAAPCPSHTAI